MRCPTCNCAHVEIIDLKFRQKKTINGVLKFKTTLKLCRHCHKRFFDKEEISNNKITYMTPQKGGAKCPVCGFYPVRVASSPRVENGPKIRSHKCQKCGWIGQSLEREEE